jgi:hypothetical protein
MSNLELLKMQAELLENRALMYFNELGDEVAYNRIKKELDEVNARILDLMVDEQESNRKQAIIK